ISSFKRKIGGEIKKISTTRIEEVIREISREKLPYEVKKIINKIDSREIPRETLRKCLDLYLAMKRIIQEEKVNAVAIDCFPIILNLQITPCLAVSLLNSEGIPCACEADLRSLLLLILAREITDKSGWIGNPSTIINDNEMIFAHCTAALDILTESRLFTHFETKKPCAVSGKIKPGVYTLLGLSYDYNIMTSKLVEVTDSGLLSEKRCRLQIMLKRIDGKVFSTDNLIANHHVLINGDIREIASLVSWFYQIKYIEW
ncbi:MAG: hypothetical protein DRJ31_08220, partial [Candidatus Methanomethylicota archaeon]